MGDICTLQVHRDTSVRPHEVPELICDVMQTSIPIDSTKFTRRHPKMQRVIEVRARQEYMARKRANATVPSHSLTRPWNG
jgi:hypothetical protein